jgi:ankyrin repeat protein
MFAINSMKDAKFVRLLIDSGADVNAKDNHGKTALMLSPPAERHKPVRELLIKYGAKERI